MKTKLIAIALATLTVFGVPSSAAARHLAEEYAEKVQHERRERMEEEAIAARRQAQMRVRQKAAEENERRLEKEEHRFTEEDVSDEGETDGEIVERDQAGQEDERIRTSSEERLIEEKKEIIETREREKAEKEKEEEERRRKGEETKQREKELATEAQARRNKDDQMTGEVDATGESFLQQLLRRAKERAQEAFSLPSRKPVFHVSQLQPMKILQPESVDTGGTLIFSDSPEYVKKTGILYADTIKGDARVFYYHLNDMGKKCKVAVVLESVGGQYAIVRVTRRAIATPSSNYSKVGKEVQQAYFSDGQEAEKIYIAAGERHLLSEKVDKVVLDSGELASGMIDFTASAPVRVSVICYPVGKNPLTYIDEAEILPPSEHRMRGTFVGMDRIVRIERYDSDEDGVACVVLGDGDRDKFCEGVDATDGSLATNYGNYGVLYRIEASTRGKTRFFMSPMGGYFAGAVRVEAGISGTQLVNVPDGCLSYGANSIHPPFGKEETTTLLPSVDLSEIGLYDEKPPIFFEFSPPGASNLPVLFILAPEDLKMENGNVS